MLTASEGTRRGSDPDRHDILTRAARRALGNGLLTSRQLAQADEAVALVERALRAWPLRDPVGWVEEVALLDMDRANTALARLRREHVGTPTVGHFFEIYRAVDTSRPAAVCERCDGTGWVEAPGFVSHGHPYSASQPCPSCREGAARERTPVWRERPKDES